MNRLARTFPILLVLAAPPLMLYTIWINPTSAGEDDVVYLYPLRKMSGDALWNGKLPLHNPLEATGSPLMADSHCGAMFPPNWLFAAVPSKPAYSLCIFLAFSTAGAGAYLYLRRLGMARAAASFGALAFMFCGFMVGHRVHLSMIQTAAFFPWGLLCIELAAANPIVALVFFTPVAALAIMAGHWAILTYMALAWLVYALLRGGKTMRVVAVLAGGTVLAVAIAAPQVQATFALMAHATRQNIGYATMGENSFFPASAILAMFPMIMGSQTPNFFPQRWWGPWHLSEMLGYVGLVTLVLAGATVWTMYRRSLRVKANDDGTSGAAPPDCAPRRTHLVRTWTWIAAGAGVWMLGYYLPTYKLIHLLPVFNVVRCPARMLLVVDMALAVLAAVAVDSVLAANPADVEVHRLRRAISRGVGLILPGAMAVALALLVAIAASVSLYLHPIPLPFAGTAVDAITAAKPSNPAIWVPLGMMLLTAIVVRKWLARPRQLAWLPIVLLTVDLLVITRFVDVPAGVAGGPDPDVSPAAKWLKDNGPRESYLVYGLSKDYRDRPNELLLPKTGQALGLATLGSYGAWHYPVHAHLFGFNNYGRNRDWAALVRRNHLLSLYNVRYVLTAGKEFRDVIESVRVAQPAEEGENLLNDRWELDHAGLVDGVIRLQTPFLWRWSQSRQPVRMEDGRIYRISLEARGPAGGAANFLQADVVRFLPNGSCLQDRQAALTVFDERIGTAWRRFDWTFQAPVALVGEAVFRVFSMGERPVEVRNVQLRPSHWETPINLDGKLTDGQAVYHLEATLPAVNPSDEPVAIYENLLYQGPLIGQRSQPTEERIERLRWLDDEAWKSAAILAPDISLRLGTPVAALLWRSGLPAGLVWAVIVFAAWRWRKEDFSQELLNRQTFARL